MTPEEARKATKDHIERVRHFMATVVTCLATRSFAHDESKLQPPEVEMFDATTFGLRGLTYGSPEYKQQITDLLGPALKHHYEHNRHHPEHFPDGVDGMNLVDLVEMFCDWRAATERHADGDILKSIEINKDRFGLSPQLVSILKNTVQMFDEELGTTEKLKG
jgi:hypothetical protein